MKYRFLNMRANCYSSHILSHNFYFPISYKIKYTWDEIEIKLEICNHESITLSCHLSHDRIFFHLNICEMNPSPLFENNCFIIELSKILNGL